MKSHRASIEAERGFDRAALEEGRSLISIKPDDVRVRLFDLSDNANQDILLTYAHSKTLSRTPTVEDYLARIKNNELVYPLNLAPIFKYEAYRLMFNRLA